MGFWSSVGSATKELGEKVKETTTEANALAEDYRRENDEWLKNKLKNGNFTQKMAATKILKERGYGS